MLNDVETDACDFQQSSFLVHQFPLVAISGQRFQNSLGVGLMQHTGATQVAAAFVRKAAVQVAGSRAAVLQFFLGRGAKAFFHAFMGLHFGHGGNPLITS
jgi:hypothetical protein